MSSAHLEDLDVGNVTAVVLGGEGGRGEGEKAEGEVLGEHLEGGEGFA